MWNISWLNNNEVHGFLIRDSHHFGTQNRLHVAYLVDRQKLVALTWLDIKLGVFVLVVEIEGRGFYPFEINKPKSEFLAKENYKAATDHLEFDFLGSQKQSPFLVDDSEDDFVDNFEAVFDIKNNEFRFAVA